MAGRKKYEYQLIDRATERQDNWYLQQRREISEEESGVQNKENSTKKEDENKKKSDESHLLSGKMPIGEDKEKGKKEAGKNVNIPVPYPNGAKDNSKSKHTLKDKKVARLSAKRERNKPAIANGDEQGVLKGLISNHTINKNLLKAGLFKIKVEREPVDKIKSDTEKPENKKTDDNKIIDEKDKIEVELKDEKKPEEKELLQPEKTEKPPELLRAPVITVDTTQLKKDAELQKKQLKITLNKEEQKFAKNATLHRKSIDKEYSKQVASVTHDYDGAITRVKQALKTAQAQVAKGKIEKRNQLILNAAARTLRVDAITLEKQNEFKALGIEYGNNAKSHGNTIIQNAAKKYETGRNTIDKNATNAIAPYKTHEYFADVNSEVWELATDIKKDLVDSTYELQTQIKVDANDMATKFNETAATGVSKMPDGKGTSKKNIANLLAEGLKQFEGISTKPLQEFTTRVNATIAELQKSKKEALGNLRKQNEDALNKISEKETQGKKSLSTQNDKLVKLIDTITEESEKLIANAKPELANQLLAKATHKINETAGVFDQSALIVSAAIDEQQVSIVSTAFQSFRYTASESARNAESVAANTEKGSKQTSDNIIDAYDQVILQVSLGMDNELVTFSESLDKTIADCRLEFDTQLTEGIGSMNGKANDVFSENDSLVADSRQQFIDKAKDASEWSVGDVFAAIGWFILGAVLVIIGVILLVVIVFFLLEGLMAFFAFLLVELAAAGFVSLSVFLAFAIIAIGELFVACTALFIVLGIGISIKMFKDIFQNKKLTRSEKAYEYGRATGFFVTALWGTWSTVKGWFTSASATAAETTAVLTEEEIALANLARQESAVINIAKEEAGVLNVAKQEAAGLNVAKQEAGVINLIKTRLPRTNGRWEGEPGNSNWFSDLSEVNAITKGEPIPFKNGYPDYSKWSKGNLKFENLDGTYKDFDKVYQRIAEIKDLPNKTAAKNYLSEKGLTPHHYQEGKTIQLIPRVLNEIPHSGGASLLRNK